MPESAGVHVEIFEAFGEEPALAALRDAAPASSWPLGRDRAALYVDPGTASTVVKEALGRGPRVFVSDQSDAWVTWWLDGDVAPELLARHVETPVGTDPRVVVQAPFAHVASRMIHVVNGLVLSVAASQAHHVEEEFASSSVSPAQPVAWSLIEEAIQRHA